MSSSSCSGLIPAHAGKTPCPASSHSSRRAHPRSRGENDRPAPIRSDPRGSSPLTRGKPPSTDTAQSPPRAHPRSRGENADTVSKSRGCRGSSPLTRGKLIREAWERHNRGLIPAHAGKTIIVGVLAVPGWAHPRSRGENGVVACREGSRCGSSPLTRGKRGAAGLSAAPPRLIPAHAGKT